MFRTVNKEMVPISKDLDRLLNIYEATLFCANHSDYFVSDLQKIISDVIRNGSWEDDRWEVDPITNQWLEKLQKGGKANE
jgi:hypothetical protein